MNNTYEDYRKSLKKNLMNCIDKMKSHYITKDEARLYCFGYIDCLGDYFDNEFYRLNATDLKSWCLNYIRDIYK